MKSWLECMSCAARASLDALRYVCARCGALLDVRHEWPQKSGADWRELLDSRWGSQELPSQSGVWRYREWVWPGMEASAIVSYPEGNTNLYELPAFAERLGIARLWLKHEGENPTGSFKDRGMTSGLTHARFVDARWVACASTGNTAASLAAYAARAGIPCVVFVHGAGVAPSKQAQMLDYGARVVRVDTDFDGNLALVWQLTERGRVYLVNSLNPLRLEGQKTIIFELLQQLRWRAPDWVIVPGGNLGNVSAFGKALVELRKLGILAELPRLAVVQAAGANPFYRSYCRGFAPLETQSATTLASAIRIGNPINFPKAVRALRDTEGVVEEVTDEAIMNARALLGRQGIICEPASAATLAGLKKLRESGVIRAQETVACILTGHGLKDVHTALAYHTGEISAFTGCYRNEPLEVPGKLAAALEALDNLEKGRMG